MTVYHKDIVPNDEVFRYYFYFMQERMKMFWRKCEGCTTLTNDPILRKYKFTNVYRACDRVSQYLIRHVIYEHIDDCSEEDVIVRILLFKIFNKIETWEYLERNTGLITLKTIDFDRINDLLTQRMATRPIFNNAYMMTGTHFKYNRLKYKHEKWLAMLKQEIIEGGVLQKIEQAKSLEEVYNLLNSCSFLGGFLSYQYAIDLNYSPYINFSENSFVKAGIGAIRGIKKCFMPTKASNEGIIRFVQDNIDDFRRKYGYNEFVSLPCHEPQLIDLQNCFCETDKYLRAKMPELLVGNVRIKQTYHPSPVPIHYYFPDKWNINKKIPDLCSQPNTTELMISW